MVDKGIFCDHQFQTSLYGPVIEIRILVISQSECLVQAFKISVNRGSNHHTTKAENIGLVMGVMGMVAPIFPLEEDLIRTLPFGEYLLIITRLIGDGSEHGPVWILLHQGETTGDGIGKDLGIAVEEEENVTGSRLDSHVIATCIAPVAFAEDGFDSRIRVSGLFKGLAGLSVRAVVNDDDLNIGGVLLQAPQAGACGLLEIVEADNNDTAAGGVHV